MELNKLEEKLEYTFKNKLLLKTALTHTSYANERNIESNEKLEFLGDSVLQLVSSKYIYEKYSELKEGEMTKVRASVVCGKNLYGIAKKHDFSDFLYLGKSEKSTSSRSKFAILEDSVEAVIAAMYLDGGLEVAQKFILENIKESVKLASKDLGTKDYKTVLQEKLQVNGDVLIEYKIINEEGPDHDKNFETEVSCNGKVLAKGRGKSKKEAHMQAAKIALEKI